MSGLVAFVAILCVIVSVIGFAVVIWKLLSQIEDHADRAIDAWPAEDGEP